MISFETRRLPANSNLLRNLSEEPYTRSTIFDSCIAIITSLQNDKIGRRIYPVLFPDQRIEISQVLSC